MGIHNPRRAVSTRAHAAETALDERSSIAASRSADPVPARETALALVLLILLPLAAFWPVLSNGFITYDDDLYVTANPEVQHGLSWRGLRWALTTGQASNWHPLTWVSHMIDVSLFGMNPGAHHATSLALHVANTLLLFLLLRRLTGVLWRSAAVAALFAVHPAHVESVAWAAERKDVLSTLFWLAAMHAYVSYVARPTARRYALVVLAFAAGLLSKPMVVTLPVVLLLVDWWPLRRLGRERRRALLEKAPLFAMSAAASVVTFLVQRAGGAVRTLEAFPLGVRLANAVVAFASYLGKLVWPARLAVLYPHPGRSLSAVEIAGAAVAALAVALLAIGLRKKAPYLFVGLGWFAVTLAPVIGVVQVGDQAMADRYTYIPSIGFFLAVAWSAWDLARRSAPARATLRVALAAALVVLTISAAAQARAWKNSETIYLHSIAVTGPNPVLRSNLADVYNLAGRPQEGLVQVEAAIRARPDFSAAHVNRGHALYLLGRMDEAAQEFSIAARLAPVDPVPYNNLGSVRLKQGDIAAATDAYRAAARCDPRSPEYRIELATMLLLQDRTAEARAELDRAIAVDPKNRSYLDLRRDIAALSSGAETRLKTLLAVSHRDAALAANRRGRKEDAAAHLARAVELLPNDWAARCDLGGVLAELGRTDEAIAQLNAALALNPKLALAHNDLGYIFFTQGKLDRAIEEYRAALAIDPGLALAQANLDEALRRQKETGAVRR